MKSLKTNKQKSFNQEKKKKTGSTKTKTKKGTNGGMDPEDSMSLMTGCLRMYNGREKNMAHEESEWEIQGRMQRTNIPVMGIQERLEVAKRVECIFKETLTEDRFPNQEKFTTYEVKDLQSVLTQSVLPQGMTQTALSQVIKANFSKLQENRNKKNRKEFSTLAAAITAENQARRQ